jgi:hypothetical protein
MAELKTKLNDASVLDFLSTIEEESKRDDCYEIMNMMQEATGDEPKMWGSSIIGFGIYHYKYASGREGDWMRIGFSPRKQNITLYLMAGTNKHPELLEKIGKYKTGKSCFYIRKLDDIDRHVLKQLIDASLSELKRLHN